tara:strand:- start:26 stop:526 length:501 start_codon:yes stop_codon:yes gene_type:complete
MNQFFFLYKSLLNRNPNNDEIISFNKHKNIKFTNKEIIISQEYKDFIALTKRKILETILNVFMLENVELTIHPILHYQYMELVRKHFYNFKFLENELTKLFHLNEPKIKMLVNELYYQIDENKLDTLIKNSRMILLTNNFNFIELEFHLVSDPEYLKMVKTKLKNI